MPTTSNNANAATQNADAQQQVNVTLPSAPEIWTENPTQGDFNPGTKAGEAIFKLKSKGPSDDKRIGFERKNAQQFRRLLQAKESTFGSVVTNVPIEFDAAGAVTERKNLIEEYACIPLEALQRAAHKRFGTALAHNAPIPQAPFLKTALDPSNNANDKTTFYDRVHSHVVAEWLKNTLDDASYATLLLKKKHFCFTDANGAQSFDGPTMLKLVLTKLDPSVVVGVEVLRMKLEVCRLYQFGNNVDKMCTYIEETMKQIDGLGKDCDSIRRYTITALSSGPNAKFNTFIDRINDDIESGTGPNKNLEWDDIIDAARAKYLNMESMKEWEKVDPHDAKLTALTTELNELKAARKGNDGADASRKRSNIVGGVPEWRTIKKGDTIEHDGKTLYWCPHHKHPQGLFDGLYCWHKPENHDEWKAKFKKPKTSAAPEDTSSKKTEPSNQKLSLNDRLKIVLCTKLMLSDEDAANICKEVGQEK